jgi:N-hydroxyarylamine O-acetyltransferase
VNRTAYLGRIGIDTDDLSADVETLRRLQHAHLMTVPFENLDIHWNVPIVLDTEKFFTKIVEHRRGGFCYELNGLFNELLRDLGYETRLISARVFNGKDHGPEFDHAAIIVTVDGEDFLTDVGFGAFTAEPLRYVFDVEQLDPCGAFMVRRYDGGYIEAVKRDEGSWHSEYIFRDVARDLPEFAEMCDFQQHSPDSHFNKSKLCSIMTDNGRKTLTDRTFILTANGTKTETEVGSEEEFYDLLEREFRIRNEF